MSICLYIYIYIYTYIGILGTCPSTYRQISLIDNETKQGEEGGQEWGGGGGVVKVPAMVSASIGQILEKSSIIV
jgi:hypothetical protein